MMKPEKSGSINCGTPAENLAMKRESKWGLCDVGISFF
jgi:hypothetical protein